MHLVSACDQKFLPCYAAMLHSASLFDSDATHWLLSHEMDAASRAKLAAFAASLDIRLNIITGFEAKLAAVPAGRYHPTATFARLLIPDLLPQSIERAIYIDADITITESLHSLATLDLKGMVIAAVPDHPRWAAKERAHMGLPANSAYCNTGVMLMDLAAWRREKLGDQALAMATDPPFQLNMVDQSVLNFLLANRIEPLPPKWNFYDFDSWRDVPSPAIVHYVAGSKPWHDSRSPFVELYRLHESRTPFRFRAPHRRPGQHLLRWVSARLGSPKYRRFLERIRRNRMIYEAITLPALAAANRLIAEREKRSP